MILAMRSRNVIPEKIPNQDRREREVVHTRAASSSYYALYELYAFEAEAPAKPTNIHSASIYIHINPPK